MESVKSTVDKVVRTVMDNQTLVMGWLVVLTVLVLFMLFMSKEKFINEFRSAPLSTQLPTNQLGVGVTSRFQEFSSTNQGGSHVVGEIASQDMEHMMGSSEPPVYFSGDRELDEYQFQTSRQGPVGENFSNRPLYSDAFGNPDDKLKQVLAGH